MIIIKDVVISALEKLKCSKQLLKAIIFILIAIILVVSSVIFAGTRVTYNVKIGGKVLASIAEPDVYADAMCKARSALPKSDLLIDEAEVEKVVSVNSKTASSDEVAEIILKNSPSILSGYAVKADGKVLAYVENTDNIEKALSDRLSAFDVEGAESKSTYSSEITYAETYFHKDQLTEASAITASVSELDVVTVASTSEDYVIEYETITKKDSTKDAGTETVVTAGVNGTGKLITKTTYVNGKISGDPVVDDQIISSPTDKVVLIGTKNVYYTSAPQNASSYGFKWPLTIRGKVTSYWGDGRGHKGMDICVPEGTSVLAAKSGRVVESGYSSDYGYHVTIDHGNGLKTRYAHNSKNVVSVGERVAEGQLIALSGNTGYTTGAHLHFEVHVNGQRVNPANYIGF